METLKTWVMSRYLFTTVCYVWMEINANGRCLQKLQAAPIFFSEEEEVEGGGEGS